MLITTADCPVKQQERYSSGDHLTNIVAIVTSLS